MSYDAQVEKLKMRRKIMYNRYWLGVSRKMRRLYFWECVIKKKRMFSMTFEHKLWKDEECNKVYVHGFDKDDRVMIEFYAKENGFTVISGYLLGDKSVYHFAKKTK